MNTDQVKGKIKEVAGEIQEHVGRFFGSDSQEQKGHNLEHEGKTQQAVGDFKEAREDTEEELKDRAGIVVDPLAPHAYTNLNTDSHNLPLKDPDGILTPGVDSRGAYEDHNALNLRPVSPVGPIERPIDPLDKRTDLDRRADTLLNEDGDTRKI